MVNFCILVKCDVWLGLFCYLFAQRISGSYGILPEASQEGSLRPFKSYADVTLFHYNVPAEVTRATWEFAAFMDHPNCPIREAHIFIQHGSYPVMSVDNASFPDDVYTGRTSLFHLTIKSVFQPHDATVFPIYNPLPGSWFAAAYLSKWDKQVTQEGLGVKCHYSLGSVALWSQVPVVSILRPDSRPSSHKVSENLTYFKVFVPSGTWSFQLKISNCSSNILNDSSVNSTRTCIQNMALRPRALPHIDQNSPVKPLNEGEQHIFSETQPYSESYYYLLIVAESAITFSTEIVTKECSIVNGGRDFRIEMAAAVSEIFSGGVTRIRHSNQSVLSDWAGVLNSGESLRGLCQNDKTETECLPTFLLARITHAQDFSDTFLLQGSGWYTTWIGLNDDLPVFVQFDVLPFLDIGATLSISVHLDELSIQNSTDNLLTVQACIRKGRPPRFHNGTLRCQPDLLLSLTSANLSTLDASRLLPYPEPDTWFIGFQALCSYQGATVPCALDDALLSLDIRTHACLFYGQPCGPHGVCQETHKGLHFFTTCNCMEGETSSTMVPPRVHYFTWSSFVMFLFLNIIRITLGIRGFRGWGCTDGSEAETPHQMVLSVVLLTGSNVFFVPSIVIAFERRLFSHVVVYAATMIFSMLYHACDQDFYYYCITKYEVLQFCDFFCSILALWVTLVALAGLAPHLVSALHMVGVVMIALGVQYNRTGLFVFTVPLVVGIVILLCVWSYRSWRKKGCVRLHWCSLSLLLPPIILAGTGIILFAFIETEHNYQYVHSIWHMVMGLSLVFLLPKPDPPPEKTNVLGNEVAELFGTTDIDALAPVFFVTSDMDTLLVSQT